MRLRIRPGGGLIGRITVPGDKSISHRAALLGALALGPTEVLGFLEAEDCLNTLGAIEAFGVEVTRKGAGHYRIGGVGLEGFQEPAAVLECGNSGTTARLLLGVLAGQPFWAMLSGDASLRQRPMARVAEPLRQMGATIVGRAGGGKLPLAVRGARPLRAITYRLPVASAQLKSALLLASLWAGDGVTIEDPAPSRDHTERMLRQFGVEVRAEGRCLSMPPGQRLTATTVHVPGDLSSAAFFLVAGAIVPESRIAIRGINLNPTRTGILDALDAMGARLGSEVDGDEGEPVGSLTIESGGLVGTTVGGALIPRLIDEVPALAVAAALARGITVVRDAAELRVKESDRVAAVVVELTKMGVPMEERPDGLVIHGGSGLTGGRVDSHGDHRIAMALVVAGLAAHGETLVENTACINTSFPDFVSTVNALAGGERVSADS